MFGLETGAFSSWVVLGVNMMHPEIFHKSRPPTRSRNIQITARGGWCIFARNGVE